MHFSEQLFLSIQRQNPFIETLAKIFYALDRMLMSLDLAGVFRKIKG